jgi:hypothetical protein
MVGVATGVGFGRQKGKPLFFERGANDTGGCRHGRPGWQGEALQYREDPSRLFFGMVLTR